MKYTWQSPLGKRKLNMKTEDNSLRPWDAADEYLLQQLTDYPHASRTLIVNDSFGALACALKDKTASVWIDSWCSRVSIEDNLKENDLSLPSFTNSIETSPLKADLVLMKIPGSIGLFEEQLKNIQKRIPRGTVILAAAHSRNLPPSFFKCFESLCSGASYSRIWKKARFYSGKSPAPSEGLNKDVPLLKWKGLDITVLPGVFSSKRIDPGTQFLLDHFPRVEAPRTIVDPGCGTGILSLAAAVEWPEAQITATDDSILAVESTRLSAQTNGFSNRLKTIHTDILHGIDSASADLVICNPPFHQQQKVSVETGFRFIRESARVLKNGGQLFMVTNRHLGYQKELKRLFEGVIVIAQNKHYRIFMARK